MLPLLVFHDQLYTGELPILLNERNLGIPIYSAGRSIDWHITYIIGLYNYTYALYIIVVCAFYRMCICTNLMCAFYNNIVIIII